MIALLLALVLAPPVPSFESVRAAFRPSEAVLLDRHGEVLHELRVDPARRRLAWVALDDVSPALSSGVVSVEDRRFWSHGGVDWRAVGAAPWAWVARGRRRGASTVSMQTASLLRLAPSGRRDALGKWRQMRAAWALEASWSKAEILEAYLNLVSFRGEVQGVGAAAGALFGKAPHGLTASESALLAVLVAAPNASRAFVARRLGAGVEASVLDRAMRLSAVPRIALAPHVAQRVLSAGDAGAPVRTTLDASVQRMAADVLRHGLLALRDHGVSDGAVLVVENATGDVLAYVGSGGDVSSARWVDGVRARRQAGSTLKPLLYAAAFERRVLTAAALVDDAPLEVAVSGAVYRPENYDRQFRGLVSARTALASSLNVPAVRVLSLVGGDAFVGVLRSLGFAAVVESGEWYGPGLALGGADVTLWELVGAYRALAVGGEWSGLRLRPSEMVVSRRVFSSEVAWIVGDVLADRESRSTTFGLESVLGTSFWSAVKTGTSKEMRDNWCIGFTPQRTVGVWVGNFSGRPMEDVSGVTGAAPVWAEAMSALGGGGAAPAPPPGVRALPVAFPGGVEARRTEWFLPGSEPAGAGTEPSVSVRIVAPVDGTIVAVDPEVPAGAQRVGLVASSPDGSLSWAVDGRVLGSARGPWLWEPTSGRHAVALVDGSGRARDTVRFVVR